MIAQFFARFLCDGSGTASSPSLVFRVTVAFAALAALSPVLPADSMTIDARHQLFLDDHLFASLKGIKRTVMAAEKFSGNPVLIPTQKWEPPMATMYGSVVRVKDRYQLWYKSGMGVGYAESDDGVHWTKPSLDLTLQRGERSNVLFAKKSKTQGPDAFPFFYEIFGVHHDPRDPDPTRRYKMGFLDIDWKYEGKDGDPWHKGQRRGLGVAGSPDGIHWKLIESWATEAIVDGATHWMVDPATGKYVLYGRTRKARPEVSAAWSTNDWFKKWFSGRAVARIESADFLHWDFTKPDTAPVALTAELEDRPGTEIYSMKVFPYEGIYIGLVQVFHATPNDSTLDVELAVSRDSVRFDRVGRGQKFIPLGPIGTWDRFNLSLANNDPLVSGDELRFYYGGRMYRHGPYDGADKGPERSGLGFASIKRDRFVALESSFDGGEIVTKPLRFSSTRLHLNARCDFGEIEIQAMDVSGKVIARSKTISRDGLSIPVEWSKSDKSSDNASSPPPALTEGLVTLKIKLSNAQLFALWCEP